MKQLVNLVKNAFRTVGVGVISTKTLDYLLQRDREFSSLAAQTKRLEINCRPDDFVFLLSMPREYALYVLEYLPRSNSQIRQDLFVLCELGFKRGGYFVEFGATDGVHISNTYLLEKEFGWSGILAEPARCWHETLIRNRSAPIETQCVWSNSGATLDFNETRDAELSTINELSASDYHATTREGGNVYKVTTISLNDLLDKHAAPAVIDYLSIDTEGSEFEILKNFDFSRRRFKVITCEHNHTSMREKIFKLLTANGYERKFDDLSQFDDWYVSTI